MPRPTDREAFDALLRTRLAAFTRKTFATVDPGAAYMMIRGLKTLQLRVERACENAEIVALYLRDHPKVARVFYPGFAENEGHDAASRQMLDFGMMVSFDLKGGGRAAERFINSLELWYLAASLGGVETTVSYPILTSHQALSSLKR